MHVAGQTTYQVALALWQHLCEVVASVLGCPTTAVTLDNSACVVHSASTQRLTFAEVSVRVAVAAIANVVYDAVGVRLDDLPMTAEKVYQKLQSREGRTP